MNSDQFLSPEILASGLVGALLVLVITLVRDWRRRRRRLLSHWQALRAEVTECGRIADGFIEAGIPAPLYRLPITCYSVSFPAVLTDAAMLHDDTDALLKFYSEVETLNRGLDLADAQAIRSLVEENDMHRAIMENVDDRNRLKAERIRKTGGELYAKAKEALDRHLARLIAGA